MKNINKSKIFVVSLFFIIAYSAVIFKAFQVQIIDKDNLIARSRNQIFREATVYPRRGHIYDRNGSPLAINIQTYSIFTTPREDKSLESSYKKLARIVPGLSYKNINQKISNRSRFTWLARKVELSKEQVEQIKGLEGVFIEAVPKRLYPNHETLAQTLGFVGVDNKGLAGIEFLFDKELRGEPKVLRYIRDNRGRTIKHESTEVGQNAKDIVLTIDKEFQSVAEKYLKEAVVKSDASRGGIGIIDPMTGEILAMANYPTFDPNDLKGSDASSRRLSFVTDPFEPGSTFKTFTVASALENDIARPDTNYYCEEGRLLLDGHWITEAESKRKYEWLSMDEILAFSSNVGTTKIAFDLTYPKLRQTLTQLNVDEKTGIEIPAESRGILTPNENVPPLSLSNISFGQGVAVTGIQMLAAYSPFANGGYYVRPTILRDEKRKVEKKKVFSEETVLGVQSMLIKAVENGTGSNAKISNFVIAGKTSTAQRSSPKGGYEGYVPGFIGFPVGVKKPFIIYVYIDNPKGRTYYGNTVAAPVFKKVAEYILYKNKEFDHLVNLPLVADSPQIDQVNITQAAPRFLGQGLMPNFVGLDKRSAERMAEKQGLRVEHRGVGVVSSQLPDPGETFEKGEAVRLIYTPPTYE